MPNRSTPFFTGKVYVTREGYQAKIYDTEGAGDFFLIGSVKTNKGWVAARWNADGRYQGLKFEQRKNSSWDLTEVEYEGKPQMLGFVSEETGGIYAFPENKMPESGYSRAPWLDSPTPEKLAPWENAYY